MAKSSMQKLKILYILQMLMDNTDEDHAISTSEIITNLERNGITAERKSIYDDIENLKHFGVDILSRKGKNSGYYIASRDFEVAELKLLVDAVQSSKFITEKKSNELIKKIGSLAGRFGSSKLQRQVVVSNRIKTMNESIYYNVDKIHDALSNNVKIRFKYCEWTVDKKLVPKNKEYCVSPKFLTWDDENYYLIAVEDDTAQIRHYRVDKMLNIVVTDEKRNDSGSIDIAQYSKKTFGMFAGDEEELVIRFDNSMIGVVIDRFGKDIVIKKSGNDTFIANLKVNISPQFYGWLAGLGSDAQIISPQIQADKYADFIKKILTNYEQK